MTKTHTLETLQNQMPAFFSLEQVIAIVKNIDDAPTHTINMTADQRNDLADRIAQAVTQMGTGIVNEAHFDVNDNYVEIDSLDLDESRIQRKVLDAIDNYFQDMA